KHIIGVVVDIHSGVDGLSGAAHIVRIVAKGKVGMRAPAQYTLQPGLFLVLLEWRITIFDCPDVVRPYFGRIVITLLATVEADIDAGVVHYGALRAQFPGDRPIVELIRAQHLASL